MNDRQFEAGDVVQLKSGGLLFTVVGVAGDMAQCVWLDAQGHVTQQAFSVSLLKAGDSKEE